MIPAIRSQGAKAQSPDEPQIQTPAERRPSLTWAQRLNRDINIDVEICPACGGAVRVIACIEDPVLIEAILTHLDNEGASREAARLLPCRAPAQASLFD